MHLTSRTHWKRENHTLLFYSVFQTINENVLLPISFSTHHDLIIEPKENTARTTSQNKIIQVLVYMARLGN